MTDEQYMQLTCCTEGSLAGPTSMLEPKFKHETFEEFFLAEQQQQQLTTEASDSQWTSQQIPTLGEGEEGEEEDPGNEVLGVAVSNEEQATPTFCQAQNVEQEDQFDTKKYTGNLKVKTPNEKEKGFEESNSKISEGLSTNPVEKEMAFNELSSSQEEDEENIFDLNRSRARSNIIKRETLSIIPVSTSFEQNSGLQHTMDPSLKTPSASGSLKSEKQNQNIKKGLHKVKRFLNLHRKGGELSSQDPNDIPSVTSSSNYCFGLGIDSSQQSESFQIQQHAQNPQQKSSVDKRNRSVLGSVASGLESLGESLGLKGSLKQKQSKVNEGDPYKSSNRNLPLKVRNLLSPAASKFFLLSPSALSQKHPIKLSDHNFANKLQQSLGAVGPQRESGLRRKILSDEAFIFPQEHSGHTLSSYEPSSQQPTHDPIATQFQYGTTLDSNGKGRVKVQSNLRAECMKSSNQNSSVHFEIEMHENGIPHIPTATVTQGKKKAILQDELRSNKSDSQQNDYSFELQEIEIESCGCKDDNHSKSGSGSQFGEFSEDCPEENKAQSGGFIIKNTSKKFRKLNGAKTKKLSNFDLLQKAESPVKLPFADLEDTQKGNQSNGKLSKYKLKRKHSVKEGCSQWTRKGIACAFKSCASSDVLQYLDEFTKGSEKANDGESSKTPKLGQDEMTPNQLLQFLNSAKSDDLNLQLSPRSMKGTLNPLVPKYEPQDPRLMEKLYKKTTEDNLISQQTSTLIYLTTVEPKPASVINSQVEQVTEPEPEQIINKTIEKSRLNGLEIAHQFAQRECAVHAGLDHPNIVKLHHYTETDERYSLFMEYAGDNSNYLVRKIVSEGRPIRNEEKLKVWALDILQAIAYLHSRGVIHQDIKLENILISDDYEEALPGEEGSEEDVGAQYPLAKLCDFGLCNLVDQSRGDGTAFMERRVGTHGYQPPEVQSGAWVSPAVDMWSYGVLLYEMAVSYKPVNVEHLKLPGQEENVPIFQQQWKNRDPNLLDLIRKCMKTNPKERLTAEEALEHPYLKSDLSSSENQSGGGSMSLKLQKSI